MQALQLKRTFLQVGFHRTFCTNGLEHMNLMPCNPSQAHQAMQLPAAWLWRFLECFPVLPTPRDSCGVLGLMGLIRRYRMQWREQLQKQQQLLPLHGQPRCRPA